MNFTRDIIKMALASLSIIIILFSFETPEFFNVLWVFVYDQLVRIIQKYRHYYRFEKGVSRDTYWIRLFIVLLYASGIVGLGFYYFYIWKGASLRITILIHILIPAFIYIDDYSEKIASRMKPSTTLENVETARKSMKFGGVLLVLLVILIVLVIIPGFRI